MISAKNEKSNSKEEKHLENDEYTIKIYKRTIENNTHEAIEDTKIKKVTSWRKSKSKFFQSLILNILSLGIIHIISLFYPNLYLKLYCKKREPKECDYFLVEDIYGKLTLCKKIHKKDKAINNMNINFSSDNSKEIIMSSYLSNNSANKIKNITKNLTYSFIYRSITYEYDEIKNEIIPVYMNLVNLTCRDIFNYFSEGLSSEGIVKIFFNRYGKNEYRLNFRMIYLYFVRIELPNLIIIIIISIIELLLSDFISFITKIGIIVILILVEFIYLQINVFNKYKREYTLDGEMDKIGVKRAHKFDKKTELFYLIDNLDLLPGDIIFLKSGDIVPCDCILLEGKCMANSNNLTGNLSMFLKVSLENKDAPFNYELNKENILYHGMKIVKSYSNLKQEYISALCINTGANTYKANLISNAIYFFERKREYREPYKFFGKERLTDIYIIIALFIGSIIIGLIFIFIIMDNVSDILNFKDKNTRKLLIIILLRLICKSFMPIYYLIHSIIILLGILSLKKENVNTFEKSKLLCSNDLNTLFLSKTGTLCEDKFEINGFHPISLNPHNPNNLIFGNYNKNQDKEMNFLLKKYYKDYLSKNKEFRIDSNKTLSKFDINNNNNNKLNSEKIKMKCWEYSTLFLESLLSCNNLEKNGMEIFGNSVDSEIFKIMKWDIKTDSNIPANNSGKINTTEKAINDIFPNDYYKITESTKKEGLIIRKSSINFSNFISSKTLEELNNHRDSLSTNKIEEDILQNNFDSYKLRIYKKFIKEGAFSSSSITYNFLTKELRFNTKGIPEEILEKCNSTTIPENFDKLISAYRRKGFNIILCASKKINMEFYNDFDDEDKYMHDLTFYGFVTLKNKLKREVVYALNDLKLLNMNFIISTGDDIYNTLPVGFESTILENKDIYSFDKDEIKNRIVIKKIYNLYSIDSAKNEENDEKNLNQTFGNINYFDRYSKISNNYFSKSSNKKLKSSKMMFDSENNLNILKENLTGLVTPKGKSIKKEKDNNKNSFSTYRSFYNDHSKNPLRFSSNQLGKKSKFSKTSKNLDFLRGNLSRLASNKFTVNSSFIEGINDKNEKLYYYQGIFDEHKELTEDCIYCVSGNVFNFLYKNKNKNQAKNLLTLINKKCRIFYNMTSLTKSQVIDYYREFPNNSICTIGQCQSDIDAIITSNIGINLQSPKNLNTILTHFYSPFSDLLIIKKIINVGRAVKENYLLMKISCSLYTLMINSYIICCFIRQMDVIQGQLNGLEIAFIFLTMTAFISPVDINKGTNYLFQNGKLYFLHNIFQIAGLIIIKAFGIYFHSYTFSINEFLERKDQDKIYSTFYFLFCIEQLFSTIFVLNLFCFYRKTWLLNTKFIIISLVILLYFVIVLTLSNSNYNVDIFNILYFEFFENLVDAYDENNKFNFCLICLIDFSLSIVYSRVVYFVFNKLSSNNTDNKNNNNSKK